MKTLIKPCHACGESDYTENMNRIDGKYYCQSCGNEILDKIENDLIEEVLNGKRFS